MIHNFNLLERGVAGHVVSLLVKAHALFYKYVQAFAHSIYVWRGIVQTQSAGWSLLTLMP